MKESQSASYACTIDLHQQKLPMKQVLNVRLRSMAIGNICLLTDMMKLAIRFLLKTTFLLMKQKR